MTPAERLQRVEPHYPELPVIRRGGAALGGASASRLLRPGAKALSLLDEIPRERDLRQRGHQRQARR